MATEYQFLTDQITAVEATITAYNDAILALTVGGVQEYSLDTGQSKTRVVKNDVTKLEAALDGLYNRRATLIARRDGTGTIVTSAGW